MVHLLAGHKYRDIIDTIRDTEFPVNVDSIIIVDEETNLDVGIINMSIDTKLLYLQTIEIYPRYRYHGYAKKAIFKLFEMYDDVETIYGVAYNDILDFYKSFDYCSLHPCCDHTICSEDGMYTFSIPRYDY